MKVGLTNDGVVGVLRNCERALTVVPMNADTYRDRQAARG